MKVAHLVELPQILLLCLVDDSQDSGDRLADNTAATIKQFHLPSKTTNDNKVLHIPSSNVPQMNILNWLDILFISIF